jgi:hypothetical protein
VRRKGILNGMTSPWHLLFFLLFLLYAPPLSAQTLAEALPSEIEARITVSPEYPRPGDTVTLTLSSLTSDLSPVSIEWSKNGERVGGGVGVVSFETTAGPLGSSDDIRAVLFEDGLTVFEASAAVVPTELFLIAESDSHVPLLYRGRAESTVGSSLRLEADPFFVRANGSRVPVSEIVFTWRRNGNVIPVSSGRGKQTATIALSPLARENSISVEARSADGTFSHEKTLRASTREPILTLYEKDPLLGVLYHHALSPYESRPDVETSFVAVPYFFPEISSSRDPRLLWSWRVNGLTIEPHIETPEQITLRAGGESRAARIDLSLDHQKNLFATTRGAWSVLLGNAPEASSFTDL